MSYRITHALALGAALSAGALAPALAQPGDHDVDVEFRINKQRLRETLDLDREGLHGTGDVRLVGGPVRFDWLRNGDTNVIRQNGDVIGAETGFRVSTRFTKPFTGTDQLSTDELRAAIDQGGNLFAGADISGKLYGTKNGVGFENAAGVNIPLGQAEGTIAQGDVKLELDMKIVSIRIISQGEVTKGGLAAGAETEFDVTWEGNVKVSAAVGANANIFRGLKGKIGIEIEIDKAEFKAAMLRAKDRTKQFLRNARTLAKRALDKTVEVAGDIKDATVQAAGDIKDATVQAAGEVKDAGVRTGHRTKDIVTNYRGTSTNSDRPTATPATGAPVDLSGSTPAQIAARFAPVIAQKLEKGSENTLRRVNFDGNWDTTDNKENSAGASDRTPAVYFDVKESATHYYVTYAFYFARQEVEKFSSVLSRENDMEGVTVVVRKGARAGQEIEMVITTQQDGSSMTRYASEAAQDWEAKELAHPSDDASETATRSGAPRFIDEVGHAQYDSERTHPQLYVTPRTHNVWAYNGRDDVNYFGKKTGVVYHPSLAASAPSAGSTVGYDLLPLSDVTSNATIKNGERLRGGSFPAKDKARLPSSWSTHLECFEKGSLFNDPASVLNSWYEIPGTSTGLAGSVTGQ